jgi:hypothetical protein
MHHLYLYIHFYTYIYLDANDLWEPHFVHQTAVESKKETKDSWKLKRVKQRRAIILYEHHEHTRECINTPSQSSTTTHTHNTHTCLFGSIQFLEPGGTQFETLYGNHISNATNIYLYIQHAIYIYMTIQQQRETIASFPLSL